MALPVISGAAGAMAGLLGMKNDKTQREVVIFHQILLILTGMIFLIFLTLPAEVDLRDPISEANLGMWQVWFDLLHDVDNPWNAWPSLHIVQSMLVVLVVNRWYKNEGKRAKLLLSVLWICWILLVVSITTTKQHYLWDAISALIVGFLAWKYWMEPMLEKSHSEESIAYFEAL